MAHRGGGGEDQPRDHCHDGGERDRSHEGEHQIAKQRIRATAQGLRQQRRGQVAAAIRRKDVGRADQHGGTGAQEQREQIEPADDPHRPDHRGPRRLRGGHREEAHQDVRHAGGAEHQRHAERNLVDRALEVQTRFQEALPELGRLQALGGVAQQAGDAGLDLRILDHVLKVFRTRKTVLRPDQDHHDQ